LRSRVCLKQQLGLQLLPAPPLCFHLRLQSLQPLYQHLQSLCVVQANQRGERGEGG